MQIDRLEIVKVQPVCNDFVGFIPISSMVIVHTLAQHSTTGTAWSGRLENSMLQVGLGIELCSYTTTTTLPSKSTASCMGSICCDLTELAGGGRQET